MTLTVVFTLRDLKGESALTKVYNRKKYIRRSQFRLFGNCVARLEIMRVRNLCGPNGSG